MGKKSKIKHKQRFSALDLSAACVSLTEKLKSKRLTNIYDADKRNYLFKFGGGEAKEFIHLEIGIRFHSIRGDMEKKIVPSGLTMKLRKNLKSKRLEKIEQIGVERVLKLTFGSGPVEMFLFLEFYSKGNMVLTDKNLVAISVARSYTYNEEEKVAIGSVYPVHLAAKLTLDDLSFSEGVIEDTLKIANKVPRAADLYFMIIRSCHMGMINPILRQFGVTPNKSLREEDKEKFMAALKYGKELFERPMLGNVYLIRMKQIKQEDKTNEQDMNEEQKIKKLTEVEVIPYFEFSPILFKEYQDNEQYIIEEFDNFDDGLAVYYDNLTRGNLIKKDNIEDEIWKKFKNIKADQQERIEEFVKVIDDSYLKAQLIEANIPEIQAVIDIIRSLIDIGMTSIVKSVITMAKNQGDPLANIIRNINLSESKVDMLLGKEDNMEETIKIVEININFDPYENAQMYYGQRSKLIEKKMKTTSAADDALKNAEEAAIKQMNKHKKAVKTIKTNRRAMWYEKFFWFISSENFLVISARDAQQNEAIIKKYLGKNDLVFHTQIQGSAFTLVKNPKAEHVGSKTLNEAAQAALCHSKSWKLKVINDVYWVYSKQVSKTAPTGLSIGAGSFMIYGKKNFIRPRKLELGFGLIFKVSEESKVNHKNERRNKLADDQELPIISEYLNEDHVINVKGTEFDTVSFALPTHHKKKKQNNQHAKKDKGGNNQGGIEDEKPKIENFKISERNRKKKMKKIKKMQKKYGEYDKEENEMRMRLIGAQKIREIKTENYGTSKKAKRKVKLKEKRRIRNEMMKARKQETIDTAKKQEETEGGEMEETQKPVEDKQQQKEEEENKEKISKKEDQLDEKVVDPVKEEEKQETVSVLPSIINNEQEEILNNFLTFNNLTGKPVPSDILLEAIPVCAPYNSISDYKYKIKLQPGNLKKGKARKTAFHLFEKVPNATKLEKGLIRGIPDNTALQQLLGNVKVQAVGMQKMKAAMKNKKKQKKQARK